MAELKREPLHIPFKEFAVQRGNQFDGMVRSHVSGDVVTPTALDRVLNDVLSVQADDYRNNWLELERWAERRRDELGSAPLLPPAPYSVAVFFTGARRPLSKSYLSDWPGASPSPPTYQYDTWTIVTNTGEPGRYEYNASLGSPCIRMPGVYRVTTSFYYEVEASSVAFCEFQSGAHGMAENWFTNEVHPQEISSGSRFSVEGVHMKTVVFPTYSGYTVYSEYPRLGIFANSSQTQTAASSAIRQQGLTITYARLPVAYP